MTCIGKNIRKIRNVKKLSQSAFADLFKITRASIGAYEEGRAEPKIETLVSIAKYFSISVDAFITKELTINEISHFDIFKDQYLKNKKNNSADNNFIRYVAKKHLSDYPQKRSDETFIKGLEFIKLPIDDLTDVIAFEHKGNDMFFSYKGVNDGDILICRRVENISQSTLFTNKLYVVVSSKMILTRLLTAMNTTFQFSCIQPNNPIIEFSENQIQELWEVKGIYSRYIQFPTSVEERLYKLEQQMEKILKHI